MIDPDELKAAIEHYGDDCEAIADHLNGVEAGTVPRLPKELTPGDFNKAVDGGLAALETLVPGHNGFQAALNAFFADSPYNPGDIEALRDSVPCYGADGGLTR